MRVFRKQLARKLGLNHKGRSFSSTPIIFVPVDSVPICIRVSFEVHLTEGCSHARRWASQTATHGRPSMLYSRSPSSPWTSFAGGQSSLGPKSFFIPFEKISSCCHVLRRILLPLHLLLEATTSHSKMTSPSSTCATHGSIKRYGDVLHSLYLTTSLFKSTSVQR